MKSDTLQAGPTECCPKEQNFRVVPVNPCPLAIVGYRPPRPESIRRPIEPSQANSESFRNHTVERSTLMDDDKPTLTTSAGNAIVDNQNSMTAGPRGPVLFQDYQLLEKLAHQNRERIPERTVHAKGWGAFGTFTVTHDITSDYPKWRLFVQVMPEPDAGKTPYNPFDLTKVWPHGDYPLIEAGLLELNR